jgi:hypothetical protein
MFIVSGFGIGEIYLKTGIIVTGYSTQIVYSGYLTYLGGTLTGSITNVISSGFTPDKKRNWTVSGGILVPTISETDANSICVIRPDLCETLFPPNIFIQNVTGLIDGSSTKFFEYDGPILADFREEDLRTVNLTKEKVFITGDFVDYYNVLGVALATGGKTSGKFIGELTNFVEPGNWTIYKNWSGELTGMGFIEWTGDAFDPIKVEIKSNTFTGYWSGQIETGFNVDFCDLLSESPFPCEFIVLGRPEYVSITGQTGIYTELNEVNVITQKNIGYQYLEWPNDNSDFLINSGDISLHSEHPIGGRTRISRLGNTISGSGKFDNLFQFPFYEGVNTQKFETGSGGELLLIDGEPILKFNFKLDSSGNKIPIYSGYLCEYVRTGNNEIAIINGFPVPIPLNCSNSSQCVNNGVCFSGICWEHKFEFERYVFDAFGNPVPDLSKYQCKPSTGINGELIPNPLLDISGSVYTKNRNGKLEKTYTKPGSQNNIAVPMYEMEPDMFTASEGFFGWKESIETLTGRIFPEGVAANITGISGNGFLANICDTTYFRFEITGSGNEPNNLTSLFYTPETGKLLLYKLYKRGDEDPIQQESGGMYFYTPKNLTINSVLNTGDYYATLDFLPVQCLKDYSNSCIKFSHLNYTGCDNDGFIAGTVYRNGYDDFEIKLRITAYFIGDEFPYLSQEVFTSGIMWDIKLAPKQNTESFSFPIYKTNKIKNPVYGKFHLGIKEIGEFPPWLIGVHQDEVDFMWSGGQECSSTIQSRGLSPINSGLYISSLSSLGLDLQETSSSRPNLSNWGNSCPTGGGYLECFCT